MDTYWVMLQVLDVLSMYSSKYELLVIPTGKNVEQVFWQVFSTPKLIYSKTHTLKNS